MAWQLLGGAGPISKTHFLAFSFGFANGSAFLLVLDSSSSTPSILHPDGALALLGAFPQSASGRSGAEGHGGGAVDRSTRPGEHSLLGSPDSSHKEADAFQLEAIDLPARGVRGVYLHTGGENAGVIYWIFGGAFVGGSIKGSMGFAEQYGRRTGCDVFMIDMRLYPENGIQDAIIDACRGYEWLLTRTPAKKVLVYGLSSGGGIGLKLLQLAASTEDRATFFHAPSQKTPQPAGAILCGAWIRYTTPTYSMKEFTVVDWAALSVFKCVQGQTMFQ